MRAAVLPAVLAAVLASFAFAGHRDARADSLVSALRLEGTYLKVGLETGVVFNRERERAPLLGGVVTLVRANNDYEWYGLQADLLADGNGARDAGARWSLGPEAGVSVFGADVSYCGERLDGATRHGLAVRTKLTVGVVAVYARGSYLWSGADAASIDVGVQLKLPVLMKRPRRAYAGEAVARR
ncbi:MAG: hypothetical protein KIT31_19285 [Deltaproteobacteria bacterium]|nr:hypothetical protein [Deltaproteobacteria bacterium]